MTVDASATGRSHSDAPLSASEFARVCELVESRAGLDFREARRSLLESSLRARMQQLDLATLDGYVARLSGSDGAEEFDALINTLTITETQFLRDPAQFALLREHIFPALMAERRVGGDRRLRICSAGCSSGEEPYSLALSWREMDPAAGDGWTLDVVGIDVNMQMLEAARRRLYPSRSLRNLDPEVVARYFTTAKGGFEMDAGLAAAVRFEHGSLLDEGTLGSQRYDIIVCKNVSIYFSMEMTRRLVERLHAALSPGGYLLLGHSESLWQMENGLELVEHEGVFCYRKPPVVATIAPAAWPNVAAPPADDAREQQYAACLARIRDADWPRAESEVASLLASSDGCVPAQLLMAGIHAHLGRYREASDCAARVLRMNSLEPKAHLLLGMIAARNGRSDDAIAALRRALDLDDSLALGYFWLGNLYRDRGNLEGACTEYARAVMRHDHRELDFTEEFAADLRPGQIVDFCRSSLERLRGTW